MSGIPFLNPAWLKAGLVDTSGDAGSSGQILSSTGSGVNWINQADITIGEADIAKTLQVTVKNVSGGELTKGTVVHASPSASPPSGNVIEVIAADYDDVAKMPAIGILKETIADEAEGEAVMMGALSGIATDGFTAGDELYVGADGALTNTKPQTAGQLIQKIAVCVKSHASNGLIKIFGAGRSNDVPLPLYIDNTNQRVGIGEPSPSYKLDVSGSLNINANATNGIRFENDGNYTTLNADTVLRINQRVEVWGGGTTGNSYLDVRNTSGVAQHKFNAEGDSYILTNLGIGTTTASGVNNAKLYVNGGIHLPSNRDISGASGLAPHIGTGDFILYSGNPGSGSEKFRITNGGNVGIGTDSPGAKLDVEGDIQIKSANISNQENTDVDSAAAEMVAQVAIATYTAAFFDFVIKKGTNVRSGTVYACHDGTNVEFTETSTQDLGDTSDVVLSVDISSGNMRLIATVASNDWSVKTLVKAI